MMKNNSKNQKKILEKIDLTKKYNVKEAIKIIKESSYVKFDETLDVAFNLNLDSSKNDHSIRGMIDLPHGTGKNIKVAVISKGEKVKEAKEAGADIASDESLCDEISKGVINFELLIVSPDMMGSVGKLGKVLGPKGLMPNPKLGTVTQNISSAVKKAKSGQVQYKNDKSGIVHGGLGKLSFKDENLFENLKSFYEAIQKSKPESLKGSYIKKVTIASTMGFGLEVNTSDLH